ncbi:hypothetical protein LZC95_45585 [Pendulispora brunnea]|uniref:Uncharacterized protein n=1 Tax=Pendulispora brunnea TaxID=2905690 RepID=A0ABZ2K818_9BACT
MTHRSAIFLSAFTLTTMGTLSLHSGGCSSADEGAAAPMTTDAGQDRPPIVPVPDVLPWTPVNLFPAIWLDGDDIQETNGSVVQWTDKSGNRNDARQDTASLQPRAVVFNGHKGASFNGATQLVVRDAPSLRWGTDDFAFFTVLRYTDALDPLVGDIFVKDIGPEPYSGVQIFATTPKNRDGGTGLPGEFLMGTGDVSRIKSADDRGYADGKPHVTSFRRVGTELTMRVDFRPSGSMTVSQVNVSAGGQDVRIGGNTSSQFLIGDIAELIGVHATVSDGDVTRVETYLKDRYGL